MFLLVHSLSSPQVVGHPRTGQARVLFHEVGLERKQKVVGHSYNVCAIIEPAYEAGQSSL